MTLPTEEEFLRDVASHEMTIARDSGADRHLVFRKPERRWHLWFEVVTWPGALCIRGDMGTFVFSRLDDMFRFFRQPTRDGSLYINMSYWSEKLIASECHGRHGDGVKRFDPDAFSLAVKERYVEHVRRNMRSMPEERKELRAALEDEVLGYAESGEESAMRAAADFEHDGFRLTDFWEVDCREYTTQFVWCLYAISWAIRQYDHHHSRQASTAA